MDLTQQETQDLSKAILEATGIAPVNPPKENDLNLGETKAQTQTEPESKKVEEKQQNKAPRMESILRSQAKEWKSKAIQYQKELEEMKQKIDSGETNNDFETQQKWFEKMIQKNQAEHQEKALLTQEKYEEKKEFTSLYPDVDIEKVEEVLKKHPTLSYMEASAIAGVKLDEVDVNRRQMARLDISGGGRKDSKPISSMSIPEMEAVLKEAFKNGQLKL